MNKKIKYLVIIIINVISITGCISENEIESSMRPPKLSVREAKIENIIDDTLSSKAKLVTVDMGKDSGSIKAIDLDNDKNEEIIVFYTLESDENPLRLLVLTNNSGSWTINNNIRGVGNDFDRVLFRDITGDKNLEIIIGWNTGEYINKGLNVYQYIDGDVKDIFKDVYEEMACEDIDGDNISELMLIKLDKVNLKSWAELYTYKDNRLVVESKEEMDGTVNGHYGLKVGKASENKMGVFIDSGIGAHSSETELLVYEKGKLNNVFFDKKRGIVEKTFRAYGTESQDIDNDKIIEIALLRVPKGYENKAMAYIPWITTWHSWDGLDGLNFESEGYHNISEKYYFKFPNKWDKNITVSPQDKGKSGNKDTLTFTYVNKEESYPLLTIVSYEVDFWNRLRVDEKEKYMEITRKLNKIYLVSLIDYDYTDEINDMKLTLDEIKDSFRLME
ncbi:hypothetical protein [Dethiothermospora halolimnae]|uniref:hypothetical protein n=1 Tax=Dethiothermospora halolimnae TaxID=3114390 RepID=UPI003CCB8B4B